MPALDAGIFLADEKMTGSSLVMMKDKIRASYATLNFLTDSIVNERRAKLRPW
jgi:hypothetical protein